MKRFNVWHLYLFALALFLAAIFAAPAFAEIPANKSITLRINADGTFNTKYRNGDKPPGEVALECDDSAAPSLVGLLTGDAFSADWRQYFSGLYAASATLSVVTLTGDDAVTNGWAISSAGAGDNLTNAGSNAGSGGLLIRGTDPNGNSKDCSPKSWSYAASPGGDTTAPTIPGNLIAMPGAGTITWSWDPSTDPHDGTNNGSGVKEYDLELNGNVTVVADSGPGSVGPMTEYIIGSPSGANSTSQSGKQWTITCAGTGIDGTSDQLCMRGYTATGNFRISGKVTPGTSVGSPFAPNGYIARASSDPGAQYMAVYIWSSAQNQSVQGKMRATTGGAKTNLATVAGSNTPRWLRIERTGAGTAADTWTLSVSTDGVTYTQFEQRVNPMPTSVIVGPFVTSMSAGNSNSATFDETSISARARLSHVQNTTSTTPGRVRARDLKTPSPNVSSYSGTLSATPDPAGGGSDVKWYPGHYVIMNGYDTFPQNQLEEAGAIAGVRGVKIRFTWRALEPMRNGYTFTLINQALALCRANGLKLFLEVQDRNFNTSTQNVLPDYLATEVSGGGYYKKVDPQTGAARGYVPKYWLPEPMDRLIALHRALAAQYDSDNDVAVVGFEETAPGTGTAAAPGFTSSAWATQIKRLATATAGIWLHTPFAIKTNSLAGQLESLINHAYLNRTGLGGPDVLPPPHNGIAGDRIIRGIEGDDAGIPNMDYRGKAVISYDVQTPSLGGKEGTWEPDELADHCILTQGCHFMSWIRAGPSIEVSWDGDIKPYLQGTPLATVQTCPENLNGHCMN